MKIVEIKLSAIDVERKIIRMNDIPDIYLMSIEMVLLKEYLLLRQTGRYGSYEEYLVEEALKDIGVN